MGDAQLSTRTFVELADHLGRPIRPGRLSPRSGHARAHNLRLAEVAGALAKGATNRDAGAALTMSARTVEAHLGHIYQELGVRSRNQLARCVMAAEGHPAIPEETKWP